MIETIKQLLIIDINTIQIYLLWFLLGSFTVATLSDLKHLSAQKEFVQVWILFVLTIFATDVYYHYFLEKNIPYLILRWSLLFVVLPFYFRYFRQVAWGDVFAKMAACSLLSPFFIIIFIILVEIIDKLTRRIWKIWGKGNFYPFMPVIFFTTGILLVISILIFKN